MSTNKRKTLSVTNVPENTFIKDDEDIFYLSLKNWKLDDLYNIKEFKVFPLNQDNSVICEISFRPLDERPGSLKTLFNEVKKKASSAVKVAISQNNPEGDIIPSPKEIDIARLFLKYGDELNIPVVDQIFMSEDSFYAPSTQALKP